MPVWLVLEAESCWDAAILFSLFELKRRNVFKYKADDEGGARESKPMNGGIGGSGARQAQARWRHWGGHSVVYVATVVGLHRDWRKGACMKRW